MENTTYKKLEYITSGTGVNLEELNQIVALMEEYGQQCRKEGFESFREKVEEGVNNLETGGIIVKSYSDTDEWILHNEVLTTIKDIKQ